MRQLTLTDLFTFVSDGGGTTAETVFGRPANGVYEGHGRVCWSGTVTGRKLCRPERRSQLQNKRDCTGTYIYIHTYIYVLSLK